MDGGQKSPVRWGADVRGTGFKVFLSHVHGLRSAKMVRGGDDDGVRSSKKKKGNPPIKRRILYFADAVEILCVVGFVEEMVSEGT
ncbi:hypothetical protein Bca52824_017859 [Brassica carinata]|uniref:Uncharacterized protein n=1 Tax=Brassica carinata TaxID=52824 RepID=A0A8X8AXU3_BRACI|nr:hypothetical protein Bca52824_017859 [Brassica carinata]